MSPVSFEGQNTVFGAEQPEYLPLPAHVDTLVPEGTVTTCWQLSPEDMASLAANGGRIWLQQLSFGMALQPQRPSVECPL